MRKDSPLAGKTEILPDDLWDKPLIISRQYSVGSWIRQEVSELNIIATYNLPFNATLMVEEGLGIVWKKYQVFPRLRRSLWKK